MLPGSAPTFTCYVSGSKRRYRISSAPSSVMEGPSRIVFLDQYGYGDVSLRAIRTILEYLKNPEIILTFSVDHIISYLSEEKSFLRGVMPAELGIEQIREMLALRENGGREARWLIQNFLYRHLQERTGAPFYTCFFIKSPASHRSYWLVHISKHPRARDEMAARHWALTNHFIHHGRAGTQMLGYDPGQPISPDQIPMDFCSMTTRVGGPIPH